jgi:cytochrome bd-type quinol oxidase subunit 2
MAKVLSGFFPYFMVSSAYAQSSGAEAPADKASMLTVVIFLLLFAGACVGYFAYIWWNARKKRQREEGEKPH